MFRRLNLPFLAIAPAAICLSGWFLVPQADSATLPPPAVVPSYADLADLAVNAPLVLRAQVRKVAEVEPARAAGLRPGWARIYVEARTETLLAGQGALGESLRYLADVKRDSRGKVPKLAKQSVLLFARPVPGRPGELQLVSPRAQLPWDQATETRLRALLVELVAADAPRRVSGVREIIYVPGTLAGEGETQMFLSTPDGEPATVTVVHAPNVPTRWSVSFSEVVDASGRAPERDTLAWYRLACFLPRELAAGTNVSATSEDSAQADADYKLVLSSLGDCPRTPQ
jgi:hypothetical protein